MSPAGGAARKASVPARLKHKTDEEIKAWAREELNGQEPLLPRDILSGIKRGELREVVLRTKKSGFYLPDGTFVEAFDTPVEFGEDLDRVEKEMEQEEGDWAWVDQENQHFKRDSPSEDALGDFAMRRHWEHGKRVYDYAESHQRKLRKIHELLAKRGGPGAYGLMTHETASALYAWKPDAPPDDPVFDWTWHVVDAVLRFSTDKRVRDNLAHIINTDLLPAGVPQQSISDFLRGPDEKKAIWRKDAVFLAAAWEQIKQNGELEPRDLARFRDQFLLVRP